MNLETLANYLQSQGYFAPDIVPDKKIHRFPMDPTDQDEVGFYVCTQLFSVVTGMPYHVIVYGRLDEETCADFCTIPEAEQGFENSRQIKALLKKLRETVVKYKDPQKPAEKKNPDGWFIRALGFNDGEYFYTSSHNQQIFVMTSFSETELLKLMPIEYWEIEFPGMGAARVNWTSAKSSLMDQCRKLGIFQSRNVRGSGVWRDANRTIVHVGDGLVVDGLPVGLSEIQSRYFYTLGARLSPVHASPLSAEECAPFVDACESFRWLKSDFGTLLAGSLVTARVCGALPIRPHVWITGSSGQGKSTLLEKLVSPMLGRHALYVRGATTEAGIRQSLKANAVPILFDEFESNGQKSQESVQAVLDLLRAAWSDSDAQIVKGSAGGTATAFRLNFSAIVSSIRTKLLNDADISRFARIELAPHGSDAEHWKKLSGLLEQITPEYCDRLFARTVTLLPVLLDNYRRIKHAFAKRVSSRFGDQYGMILAGYAILLQDEVVNDAQVDALLECIQLVDEKEEARVTDHHDALRRLLTKKLRIGDIERSIIEMIQGSAVDLDMRAPLERVGIRVDHHDNFVYISSGHTELETLVFHNTAWSKSWGRSLIRLEGSERKKMRIAGLVQDCVKIPLHHFS
jgi:putative DNA primase/helicase